MINIRAFARLKPACSGWSLSAAAAEVTAAMRMASSSNGHHHETNGRAVSPLPSPGKRGTSRRRVGDSYTSLLDVTTREPATVS